DFGGADMATQMAAEVTPGVDLAADTLLLIHHSVELGEAATRLRSQGKHKRAARAAHAEHLALGIGQFKKQNTAVAVGSGVDILADVIKITGAAISLSGIGVIVGHPLKAIGITVALLNKAGMGLYDASKTGEQQRARAGHMLGVEGSAEKLMAR